jgi:hypothetical protein
MVQVREVERYVLQIALSRGWITQKALEQAATFRTKQTERGRKTTLLRVLRPFVSPANFANLERTWQAGLKFAAAQEQAITATGIEDGLADGEERPPPPARPPATDPKTAAIDFLDFGDGSAAP